MEYDPKNLDVVDLLKKLREAGGGYPQEMLALRRQGYLKQVGEVAGSAGLALAMRESLKSGKGAAGSSAAAGKVVEVILVAAIVLEAGAVTYFYRDKVADFFRGSSTEPRVEEVAIPPVMPSAAPESILVPTFVETPTFTVTATPVSTATVELAAQPTEQNHESGSTENDGGSGTAGGGGGSQSVSTPSPNANNNNGNNGNHYGQTPKPERTRQPGNEVSNNNQNNRDRPTKER